MAERQRRFVEQQNQPLPWQDFVARFINVAHFSITLWNVAYGTLHAELLSTIVQKKDNFWQNGTFYYAICSLIVTVAQVLLRYTFVLLRNRDVRYRIFCIQTVFCGANFLLHIVQTLICYHVPHFTLRDDNMFSNAIGFLCWVGWLYYATVAIELLKRVNHNRQRRRQRTLFEKTFIDTTKLLTYKEARQSRYSRLEEESTVEESSRSDESKSDSVQHSSNDGGVTSRDFSLTTTGGHRHNYSGGSSSTNNSDDSSSTNSECCVCLNQYESSGVVCQLACGHYFHVDCIQGWLKSAESAKGMCPVCKQQYDSVDTCNYHHHLHPSSSTTSLVRQ